MAPKDILRYFIWWVLTVVTLPVWLSFIIFIYILILCIDRHDPLFVQERGGYRGSKFKLIKFRTMPVTVTNNGECPTKLGSLLRRASIDEIPSLVNVLLGQMTLVGPRPLLAAYLAKYTSRQKLRHNVLPGLTGWAQINGRNSISWHKKFALDLWYVSHRNLWIDLQILASTLDKVMFARDVNQSPVISMERLDQCNRKT